jgi:inhibitor of KinA sporulation pathway (predicted exonuclease)
MIAFLDAEFNTDSDIKQERTDISLIEVEIVVADDKNGYESVYTYHAYVKPIKNNGLLYQRIIDMTHISQEDVDKSETTFQDVLNELADILKK